MSWIRSDDQRALFGEILDESARALGEAGNPRAAALLKLAAADSWLIGLESLGASLRGLADRIQHYGLRYDEVTSFGTLLGNLARGLRSGGDVAMELEVFRRLLSQPPSPPPPSPPVYAPPEAPRSYPTFQAPPAPPVEIAPPAPYSAPAPRMTPPAEPAPPPEPPREERPLFGSQVFLETPGRESSRVGAPELEGRVRHEPVPRAAYGSAILLDPGPVSRSMLARMLRKLLWTVEEHDRSAAALDAWSQGRGDLFIADARRLRVAVRDLVEEVRRRSGGRPARVALLVDGVQPEEERLAREHGAAGVLRRPVEEEALKQFLDSLTPPGGRA